MSGSFGGGGGGGGDDVPAELWYELADGGGARRRWRVPTHGAVAHVGDYGQASYRDPRAPAVRVGRCDLEQLDAFGDPRVLRWGQYSIDLAGARGYDAQFLTGYALAVLRRRLRPGVAEWLAGVQARLGGAAAVTRTGRPAFGRVSDAPPWALLDDGALFGDWRADGGPSPPADAAWGARQPPNG